MTIYKEQEFKTLCGIGTMALALFFAICPSTASAQKIKPLSKAERQVFERVIREYLVSNPKVLREAMTALDANERLEKQQSLARNIKTHKSALYSDARSPVAGNPNGDVTIVVFSDYSCGYCRKTIPALESLLATDKSIRIIYKEFPILGPQSHLAALAALAASKQGQFLPFHRELLAAERIDDEAIKAISMRLGLNYDLLQSAMQDGLLNAAINSNMDLASALQIEGTPAFIIGDQVIPGAADLDSIKAIVAIERKKLAN